MSTRNYQTLNQNEYVTHPELYNFIKTGWKYIMSVHMFFYIVIVLISQYFPFLATMDAVITAGFLLFGLVLRPLMLRGVIPAYFRKSYDEMKFTYFLGSFVVHGAIFRTAMFTLFYLITFMLVKDDARQVQHYVLSLHTNLLSKEGAAVGVLVNLFFLFRFFYSDTFITIKDYSNRVVRAMRQLGTTVEVASNQVMKKKQLELERKAIQGVRYDEEESHMNSSVNNNRQTSEYSEEQVQQNTDESIVGGTATVYAQDKTSTAPVPIRRQARRE